MSQEKRHKSVPVGTFSRGSVAAGTAAKMGMKRLSFLTKTAFQAPNKKAVAKKKHDQDLAETLFLGLGELKGTALKAAQAVSMEFGLVPESFRDQLFKSHYQAPPLNRAIVRRVIEADFGKTPEQLFKSFQPEAFAAASLGQVHRAVAHDGTELAVKIQYPGIKDTLMSDMKMAKRFVRPFINSNYLDSLIEEIAARLKEEVDYDLELKTTQWFHDHLKMKSVRVPQPRAELCSASVITTTLVPGRSFLDFLESHPSQETRDHFAQVLWELFLRGTFEIRRLHADPNPGNYLFCDDGKLGLIDFGCTKNLDEEFCGTFQKMWSSHIRQEPSEILEAYKDLGFKSPRNEKSLMELIESTVKPFGDWVARPLRADHFDFGKHPDYCEEGTRLVHKFLQTPAFDEWTKETVFVDRTLYGLFRLFTAMKAKVRLQNQWVK